MDVNKRASITEEAARERGVKFRRSAREWIISAAAVLLAAAAVRSSLFTLVRVDGNSMSGTLQNGERMLVSVADVALNGVDRGDVVICRYPNRGWDSFVKRVVAVPGDAVYREYGVTHVVYAERTARGVEIHDNPLDPAYILTGFSAADDYAPRLLGNGEYFVGVGECNQEPLPKPDFFVKLGRECKAHQGVSHIYYNLCQYQLDKRSSDNNDLQTCKLT